MPLLVTLLTLGGCMGAGLTQGGGSGNGGGASSGDGGADAGIETAYCGTVGSSTLELCRETSECPGLVVDSDLYPRCGFRVRGGAVDLVCACDDSLCAMGAYTSCAQARALLEGQSELAVCMQVAEGRCAALPTGTSQPAASGCDRVCLSECGGGAGCAEMCGCGS